MVTIEAVPGRRPRAMTPVLEGVVVAIAGGVKVPLTIGAAPNAIRTGQLSTPIASAEVASVVRADVLLWIPAKLAAVGEVHSSLFRRPGIKAGEWGGDVIGHLYYCEADNQHTPAGIPALPLGSCECAPTQPYIYI